MEPSGNKAARVQETSRSHAADAFVVLAMTLTTVALAIGLYLQFRLAFWLAVVAALSVYVGLLALHAVVRRSERVEHLTAEIARLEGELQRATAGRPATGAVRTPGSAAGQAPTHAPKTQAAQTQAVQVQGAQIQGAQIPASLSKPEINGASKAGVTGVPSAPRTAAGPVGREAGRSAPPEAAANAASTGSTTTGPTTTGPTMPAAKDGAARTADTQTGDGRPAEGRPAETAVADRALPERAVDAIMSDYWAFRPSQPPRLPDPSQQARSDKRATSPAPAAAVAGPPPVGVPATAAAPPPLPVVAPAHPPVAAMAPSSPREADVEMIQGLIKKLADEVNAAEAGLLQRTAAGRVPAAAIETSVNALRTAADQMRQPAVPARTAVAAGSPSLPPPLPPRPMPETAAMAPPPLPTARPKPVAADTPQPWSADEDGTNAAPPAGGPGATTSAAHARLAALAEAITAGRLDVMLEPILGLADQRARHFEVSVQLRDKNGHVLEPPENVPELRDSGLLPLLDCARIQRSAQVASRLADRNKPGSLFSTFSGEALGHDQFLADFTDAYSAREALATQLVLSFAQSDVRAFVGRDWDMIGEMHELGFRFALQSVTDLDLDFEALKVAGFDFVKLDASVFLDGMPASGGMVPASDICRHLAQLGMTLVVGGIVDEGQLARVFGFGVIYGQGQLFGGARPMKVEVLAGAAAASHVAA
jgi:cyclic-di-GMP phosphodiesterase TipF (flagellum assembly factor)